MVFSSVTFLFYFLPAVLTAYLLLPRLRRAVLLVASFTFYAWGEPRFVPLLVACIVITHLAGRYAWRHDRIGRTALWLGVGANLVSLLAFKYLVLLLESVSSLLIGLGSVGGGPTVDLPLPLGISFFTFQALSYLVDVRRGHVTPSRSLARTALYVSMFPQLVAGPIVRYRDIVAEMDDRRLDGDRIVTGLRRFLIGMSQKVLIANTVAVAADRAFDGVGDGLTAGAALVGVGAYTLQIYFDFAGYSNMAIGLGHIFGFTFPENFDTPYASRSVTEFWRRWHMSLSSWFRDYLYIPLGGNRGGRLATYRNLVVVFALCGLWHGAAWTFLAWGLYHGAFLVVERAGLERILVRLPVGARHLYLVVVVAVGWIPFRADTFGDAARYLGALLGRAAGRPAAISAAELLTPDIVLAMLVGAVLAVVGGRTATAARSRLRVAPARWRVPALAGGTAVLAVGFALSVVSVAGGAYDPFIYFRF